MRFDWTLDVGHIFTVISVVASIVLYLSRNAGQYVRSVDSMKRDMREMSESVSRLNTEVRQLRDIRPAMDAIAQANDEQTKEIARFSQELRSIDTRNQILERSVDRLEKRQDSLEKEVLRARENIHDIRNQLMMHPVLGLGSFRPQPQQSMTE